MENLPEEVKKHLNDFISTPSGYHQWERPILEWMDENLERPPGDFLTLYRGICFDKDTPPMEKIYRREENQSYLSINGVTSWTTDIDIATAFSHHPLKEEGVSLVVKATLPTNLILCFLDDLIEKYSLEQPEKPEKEYLLWGEDTFIPIEEVFYHKNF